MCGIVGYIGKKKNIKWIVEILKKLEYRGYDSAGIAVHKGEKINVIKEVGEIDNLLKVLPEDMAENAIAHTRWATHGKPCRENAHPHQSSLEKWTIVHNGIIENSDILKNTLNLQLMSETDTEVLVHHIEKYCQIADIRHFIHAFNCVQGAYAVVCQCSETPESLYLAKNKSPLYVAVGASGVLVASDPICFYNFSDFYYSMQDFTFALVTKQGVKFYDQKGKLIHLTPQKIDSFDYETDKKDFPHFMIKEIFEQPKVLKRQVEAFKRTQCLRALDNILDNINQVVLIGSGTAFHAAMVGKGFFEEILNINAKVVVASEFDIGTHLMAENVLFVIVSQSGETADALIAQQKILDCGGKVLAVTNIISSTLAKNSSFVLPIFAGREIAVASTKAYVCQISSLYLLVRHLEGKFEEKAYEDVCDVANKILSFDKRVLDNLAEKLALANFTMFIGKHQDYVTAKESALKLQEITYIPALSLYAGELKHGYLAVVTNGVQVFVFATNEKDLLAAENAAHEIMARGGEVVLVSTVNQSSIKLSNACTFLMPIISIVPMQYLAYKVSIHKELNPDKPRNLAKSVTVA